MGHELQTALNDVEAAAQEIFDADPAANSPESRQSRCHSLNSRLNRTASCSHKRWTARPRTMLMFGQSSSSDIARDSPCSTSASSQPDSSGSDVAVGISITW